MLMIKNAAFTRTDTNLERLKEIRKNDIKVNSTLQLTDIILTQIFIIRRLLDE